MLKSKPVKAPPAPLPMPLSRLTKSAPNPPLRFQAELSIDAWSERLLDLARSQARSNRQAAIAIASQIPRASRVYESAQSQIQSWQQ
ncbi:MAG: hypothetical protein HC792_06280 [Acaryochloridaceae cyanobacterium CSU_5_19]|nr:hypothetical protein [Acaryochloridaceae cyanobacterium CSU_5_19]